MTSFLLPTPNLFRSYDMLTIANLQITLIFRPQSIMLEQCERPQASGNWSVVVGKAGWEKQVMTGYMLKRISQNSMWVSHKTNLWLGRACSWSKGWWRQRMESWYHWCPSREPCQYSHSMSQPHHHLADHTRTQVSLGCPYLGDPSWKD